MIIIDSDNLYFLSRNRFAHLFFFSFFYFFLYLQSREIPTIIIKLTVTTFFGLIIGGIYSNAGYNQSSINNRTGLLFVVCLNQAFNGTISVLNSFPKEKIIVNR